AVWDRHGNFTGKTIYVPGPYALPGSSIGGDIPPASAAGGFESGAFNNNGTCTGCAFDRKGHFFAADIGTAQGQIPVPDDGRIIEWFPPDYTQYCIIYGPDSGGVGPHHVDGTGGLRDPGTLAVHHGDLYVPETGAGRVLRFRHDVLPRSAAECGPDGVLSPTAHRIVARAPCRAGRTTPSASPSPRTAISSSSTSTSCAIRAAAGRQTTAAACSKWPSTTACRSPRSGSRAGSTSRPASPSAAAATARRPHERSGRGAQPDPRVDRN